MSNAVIGPALAEATWYAAAIEGTVKVGGVVFNYAGRKWPRQAGCPGHRASERLRWTVSPHAYGTGSRSNALEPFRTLACDLGTVENSTPWLNGGYARFGQRIYIPAARGVSLPDGTLHDGMFQCADVGGKITGNHVDVFIGEAGGWRDALTRNPFAFVTSDPDRPFRAFGLP